MNVQEKIEALKKQLQELEEEVNKTEDQFPKKYDEYYFITNTGAVAESIFWSTASINECKLSMGNVFKTRKEAEFMVERLKVLAELKKLSRQFKYNLENWVICYNYDRDQFKVCGSRSLQSTNYNFHTEEEAQAAIDKIGEDRLKKYYFMIGDED